MAYDLLNIDERKIAAGFTGVRGRFRGWAQILAFTNASNLGDFFFGRHHVHGRHQDCHQGLIQSIRVPCLPKETDVWLSTGIYARQRGPLGKLPVELIDMIYCELGDLVDTLLFAITCKWLLEVGKRHILQQLKECHAPWADGRLILLARSGAAARTDLPSGLLTDAEWQEIVNTPIRQVDPLSHYDFPGGHLSLADFADAFYTEWHGSPEAELRKRWPSIWWKIRCSPHYSPKLSVPSITGMHDTELFSALLRPTYPEGAMVLCNMTKGEYILNIKLTVPEQATLAHALLALITWASKAQPVRFYRNTPVGGEYEAELTRGRWAGDRFCIVTMETLPPLGPGLTGWRDVTEEASRLLAHIHEIKMAAGYA